MKTTLSRIAVLSVLALTTLASSALPVFMKIEGIKGEATSKDKRRDEIQIESWSLGATHPSSRNRVQGNRIGTDAADCTTGPLKFSVRGAAAEEVKKFCQARRPAGNVILDIDGVRHRFENASFASCQSGDGSVPTDQFSLNYAKCTYHGGVRVAVGDVTGDGAAQANARLIGLRSIPVPVHLQSLKLNPDGTSASVSLVKVGTGTLELAGNGAALPQVVLELTNGSKWTFTGVTFQDILITGATMQFSMNFTKVEGARTGYAGR